MEEELKRQWPSFISRRNITLGAALLVIIAGSIGYFVYTKSRVSPQQAQQQEIASLVAAVGKLMVLPADEQPVVATVADPEKLKDQPLFANAKKGDKVLIYSKSRKAIVYDPDSKRIINIGPVNIDSTPTPTR